MVKRSKHYIATPPGATIKEQLEDRGMTQKEFAKRMDMSEKHISKLINGETQLTAKTANKLEMVLGVPAHFWNNLEAIYREKLEKVEEENALDEEKNIAKLFPYNEMAKSNWVAPAKRIEEKVIGLRKFFEISGLKMLENRSLLPKVAFRRLGDSVKSEYASFAWAQAAKIQAREQIVSAQNYTKLANSISQIRAMTTVEPEIFCQQLVNVLADCGVAIVFLPHLKGSYLHGASFIDNNKIVLGVTVRGKDADKFWFSLFHELGHILLGHLNLDEITADEESAADDFAKECLIPTAPFENFVSNNNFDEVSVRRFAKTVGVDVGIVVGRLQKEEYISFNSLNHLKTQYTIIQ